ncbi:MAG: MBL fold metallo-hydrolase [Campylobacter sp.]|uniref:MBL fold metallo-hydrolase n=1 Tax=Campylobacter sp. TaxID=205 RepID=UPI002AA8C3A7|nr:MBL fold metallo-hydrolase [Campylobacter sp.]MCI6694498.1 MBL fold metallo-hydrolase [Campylobacter sp.]
MLKKFFLVALFFVLSMAEETTIKPDLKIGDNEIYVISLLEASVDPDLLVPENTDDEQLIEQTYSKDTEPSLYNVLLVKNPDFNMLIDTGLSSTISKLKAELRKRGVKPEQITQVAVSHGHPDHIGGLGEAGATFANATLLINEAEYKYWMKRGDEKTKKRLNMYKNRLSFYMNGENLVTKNSNIKPIFVPGHTPGMTIFNFNDEFYNIADMIYAFDVQIGRPEIAHIYDIDKKSAMAERKKILEIFKKNPNIKVMGTHFPYSEPEPLKVP